MLVRAGKISTLTGWVRNGPAAQHSLLIATALALTACVLFGGGPFNPGVAASAMLLAGGVALFASILQGGLAALGALPALARACLLGCLLLPALQLVPLPPDIWQLLPGRDLERQLLEAAGAGDAWRPVTNDVLATAGTLLLTLSMAGILLPVLIMPARDIDRMILLIVALALLSMLVGALQLTTSGRALAFFQTSHKGLLLGFFANRNHEALLIAASILCCGYLIGRLRMDAGQKGLMFGIFAFLAVAAAVGTASRAGMALTGIALISVPALFLEARLKSRAYLAGLAAAAAIAVAGIVSMSGAAGKAIARYDEVSGDYRWTIWERSAAIIPDYLPFGSGLGTFADVYMKYEQVEWLRPTFVNHAHNEYIQIAIEAGLLGCVVAALLIVVLIRTGTAAWRGLRLDPKSQSWQLAALGVAIILLILMHSTVDYPLRRPALAALFAFALGLVLRPEAAARRRVAPS
jgi:O-antigen ligase